MPTDKASSSDLRPSRIPKLKRGNELATSPDSMPRLPSGDFFHSSKKVGIGGGNFISAGTIITINHHQSPNINHEPETESNESAQTDSSRSEIRSPSSSLCTKTSPEIYTRQLAVKGRGYPLWVPEPNNRLPVQYQKNGIRIGDVGIITPYGAFDFLFNILVPLPHPINPDKMPEDFAPISPPLDSRDIRGFAAFKSNSHLASADVQTSQRGKGSTLKFESSASEGAILTMPNGSNVEELRNALRFKEYASKNAVKWYQYLIMVCGHEAENGDLHLVVGYDKTNAWGMAIFQKLSRQSTLLEFKPVSEDTVGISYGWDYSGMAEVKSGPDMNEMERLRNLDQAVSPVAYENQCLFVQTINITLQEDAWNNLVAESEINDRADDDEADQGNPRPGSSSQPSPFPPENSAAGSGPSGGGTNNRTFVSTGIQTASQSILFSHSPQAPNTHPSKKINELLLGNNPNATIALTEDSDWMSVIQEEDTLLPSADVLYSRIVSKYNICVEEGTIFIDRGLSPVGLPVLVTPRATRTAQLGNEAVQSGDNTGSPPRISRTSTYGYFRDNDEGRYPIPPSTSSISPYDYFVDYNARQYSIPPSTSSISPYGRYPIPPSASSISPYGYFGDNNESQDSILPPTSSISPYGQYFPPLSVSIQSPFASITGAYTSLPSSSRELETPSDYPPRQSSRLPVGQSRPLGHHHSLEFDATPVAAFSGVMRSDDNPAKDEDHSTAPPKPGKSSRSRRH